MGATGENPQQGACIHQVAGMVRPDGDDNTFKAAINSSCLNAPSIAR